jgi:hypothetical protein
MLAPKRANFSGITLLVMRPCSSCVQSVRRKRSRGSRPTTAPGSRPPSIVHESPDSKKSWSVGKKVFKDQYMISGVLSVSVACVAHYDCTNSGSSVASLEPFCQTQLYA